MELTLDPVLRQDSSTIAIVAYFVLLGLFLSYRVVHKLLSFIFRCSHRIYRRRLLYTNIIRRTWLTAPLTRHTSIIVLAYLVGNFILMFVSAGSSEEVGRRGARLAVANCLPLLLAENLMMGAKLLGVTPKAMRSVHAALGATAMLMALIHILIHVTSNDIDIKTPTQTFGLLSGISILVTAADRLIRRHFFEIGYMLHRVSSVTVAVSLWLHVTKKSDVLSACIIATFVTFAVTFLLRVLRLFWRNKKIYGKMTTVKMFKHPLSEVFYLHFETGRPWQAHGGEFVNIWIPGASFWSFAQSHPMMVYWQTRQRHERGINMDDLEDIAEAKSANKSALAARENRQLDKLVFSDQAIVILVKPQRGFTQSLLSIPGERSLIALIDGPYGNRLDLKDYGTVIFVVEDMGITAITMYLRDLLDQHQEGLSCIQRIKVIWQLDTYGDVNAVHSRHDELLEKDAARILKFNLYVPSNEARWAETETERRSRVRMLNRRMLIDTSRGHNPKRNDIITQELRKSHGKTLFAVSARAGIRDALQRRIRRELSSDRVSYQLLDFQPAEVRSLWARGSRYQGEDLIQSPTT